MDLGVNLMASLSLARVTQQRTKSLTANEKRATTDQAHLNARVVLTGSDGLADWKKSEGERSVYHVS